MAPPAHTDSFDHRALASLRARLAEIDRVADAGGSVWDAALAHRVRCPTRCLVAASGQRAEPCAIAEALRVISLFTAHIREPATIDLISEASALASSLRKSRGEFRERIRAYAPQLVRLHPDRSLRPRGRGARAMERDRRATAPHALELFMRSAERNEFAPEWGKHDHRACVLPFGALAAIDRLALQLDAFAKDMHDTFESTAHARRGGATGPTPVELDRHVVSVLRSAQMSNEQLRTLLHLSPEQLRNRKAQKRVRKRG